MATVSTVATASLLYVAYYGRPGDPNGLRFWGDDIAEGGLEAALPAFGNSQESIDLYGEINASTIDSVIDAIYNNLFGRDADEGGKAFYRQGFLDGEFTPASIAYNVAAGAQGGDAIIIDNKVAAATRFAEVVFDGFGPGIEVELPTGELVFNEEWGQGNPENYAFTVEPDDIPTSRAWLGAVGLEPETVPTKAQTFEDISTLIDPPPADDPEPEVILVVEQAAAAGADVMRLTGGMDVDIDFTNNSNQIVGADLDGDGLIERDGEENNPQFIADNDPETLGDVDFEIVDAYRRDPFDDTNIVDNFIGDITYDGTGFDGDGVNTEGNIFLGGLGVDRARGGIGNDFLVGGGVAQGRAGTDTLEGGRNADFFFIYDGGYRADDQPNIDGGETFDDMASQDSDWYLFEGADDNEPYAWFLESLGGNVENFDASGNLYGFLDDVDVAIGENGQRTDDGENVGIGSTGQLIVTGGDSTNIIIGGFDNDTIFGGLGNDLLFGGRLDYNNNPNLLDAEGNSTLPNDGRDFLYGGEGNDNLVLEADGGVADADGPNVTGGGAGTPGASDTFWLTEFFFGASNAGDATDDGVVRIDLRAQDLNNAAGYGGADVDGTQDQTNYAMPGMRITALNAENVIGTGLGGVDYVAAGTNDPDLLFNNQQNIDGIMADLDLRGTNASNVLYATGGDDLVEGRGGDDWLSGGEGVDIFAFDMNGGGDGKDAIWRQLDLDGDGLQDTDDDGNALFGQDFGTARTSGDGFTSLFATFPDDVDLTLDNVGVTQFEVTIDGVLFGAGLTSQELFAETTTEGLAALLNAAYSATDPDVSVVALDESTIEVRVARDDADIAVTVPNGTAISGTAIGSPFQADLSLDEVPDTIEQDILSFRAYEDRADGELLDDDGEIDNNQNAVSLGTNYAEDLVAHFSEDGTILSESQAYLITIENDALEDIVTISVNGVAYTAQRGIDIDGTEIPNETHDAFIARLVGIINAGDEHSLAGSLTAAVVDPVTAPEPNDDAQIRLTQAAPNGGEDVFMDTPVVTVVNRSGGESMVVTIEDQSATEITLVGFDGRNGLLNAANVEFIGDSGVSRAVFETATAAGGELSGSDAVAFDSFVDADTDPDFTEHGDDYLKSGIGDDDIMGLTGDDRIFGSLGDDALDGGKDHYTLDADPSTVLVLNEYEADDLNGDGDATNDVTLLQDYNDTLVLQAPDYGDTATFTIALDAGLITDPTDEDVLADGVRADITESVSGAEATATNFEAIRTINGTNAVQGRDTLDFSDVSDAAEAASTNGSAAHDAAGVSFDLSDGTVVVTYDANGNDANDDGTVDYAQVDGAENVIGGAGSDDVTVGNSEVGKENTFSLGGETASGDSVIYAYDTDPGVMHELTVNADDETDEVTVSGPSLPAPVVDTLIDVEIVDFTDAQVAAGDMDALDATSVEDAVMNFNAGAQNLGESVTGIVAGSTADGSPADVLADEGISSATTMAEEEVIVAGIDKFEMMMFGGGDDRVLVGDAGGLDGDTYSFSMGAGRDAADFRSETGVVEVEVGAGATDVVTADEATDDATHTFSDNEVYYGGAAADIINTSGLTDAVTIEFSAEEELVDPNGQVVPVVGAWFRTEVYSTATPTMVYADFIDDGGATGWMTVTGGAAAETVIVTDNETAQAHTFNLGGGANVVDASAVTTQTNLTIESRPTDTDHLFNGDSIDTDANSLTVIASLDSVTDTVDATDTEGDVGAGPDGVVVVNLATGVFQEYDASGTAPVMLNEIGLQNFENVTTGATDDTVTGNAEENVLTTGDGDDTINGGGGDDTITTGEGDKTIDGGAGGDTITATTASGDESTISGGAGNDVIVAGEGAEVVFGGAGADNITLTDASADSDRLTYDAANASDSQGYDQDATGTADVVTGFTTTEDVIWILGDDAGNLGGVASLLTNGNQDTDADVDDADIIVDLGDDLAIGGAGDDADEVVNIEDIGTVADGDMVLRLSQSAGADLQELGGNDHIAHIIYDQASDSTLGGRDEFNAFNLGTDLFDVTGLGLTAVDYDDPANGGAAADGLQLDEVLKVSIPVSVDNASSLPGFFAADPTQNPDLDDDNGSVLFVLQNEQGTANYRFFVDANQDGDFNAADDMVFDITNEPDSAAIAAVGDILALLGTSVDTLFLGVEVG